MNRLSGYRDRVLHAKISTDTSLSGKNVSAGLHIAVTMFVYSLAVRNLSCSFKIIYPSTLQTSLSGKNVSAGLHIAVTMFVYSLTVRKPVLFIQVTLP